MLQLQDDLLIFILGFDSMLLLTLINLNQPMVCLSSKPLLSLEALEGVQAASPPLFKVIPQVLAKQLLVSYF